MVRVVILGTHGQLGTDLCEAFRPSNSMEVVRLTRAELDVCDHARVANLLGDLHPDVVLNSTAYTNVEACESDEEKAFAVNCHAVRNLAQVCRWVGAKLVHISTDYVFSGDKGSPYQEDDAVQPLNVYGVSKAAGEFFVRQTLSKYLILRTSGLYGVVGASGKGGNFVETMLRLGKERGAVTVVIDQVLSPTYTADLAGMVRRLVDADASGVLHVTNGGECSWNEFARTIFQLSAMNVSVSNTTTAAFGAKATRPPYSVLDNARLRKTGTAPLRHWREALGAYLAARGARSAVAV